ncbi:MAG: hypothetical protein AB2A00_03705 [Myxococcota bacterium]
MRRRIAAVAALTMLACASDKPQGRMRNLTVAGAETLKQKFPRYLSANAVDRRILDTRAADHPARVFEAALPAHARNRVRHHPYLDWVAQVTALTWDQEKRLPAQSMNAWLRWKFGIPAVGSSSSVRRVGAARAAYLFQEELHRIAAELPDDGSALAFGVARVHETRDHYTQALVIVEEKTVLAPLAKEYQPGQTLHLQGRFTKQLHNVWLYLDQPDFKVLRRPIRPATDGSFALDVPLPTVPGRYLLEIDATEVGSGGDGTADAERPQLLIPVYVGMAEPTVPDASILTPQHPPGSLRDWGDELLRAYNTARTRAGVPPLSLHPTVVAEAQQRAGETALATRSPIDPRLDEKLRARGLKTATRRQSYATVEYLDEQIWEDLVEPGTRYHVLDPRLRWLGVGVSPKSERDVRLVRYLVSPLPDYTPEGERERIITALQDARAARHLPPFELHPEQETVLAAFMAPACEGKPLPKASTVATHLEKNGLGQARVDVTVLHGSYTDPDELLEGREQIVEREQRYLLVSVCRGRVADHEDHELVTLVRFTPATETPAPQPSSN